MVRFPKLRFLAILFCLMATACFVCTASAGLDTDEHVGFDGTGETVNNGGGSFTVFDEGGIGDIWTNGDDFQYFYDSKPWIGDFSATVRVVSTTENVSGRWGKAGIMVRKEPSEFDSAFVLMKTHTGNDRLAEPHTDGDGDNVRITWREETGVLVPPGRHEFFNAPVAVPPEPNGVPVWLRLDRVGEEFRGSWANDNGGSPGLWQDEFSTGSLPDLADEVTVGLAYSAHNNLPPGQHGVTFDNYNVVDGNGNSRESALQAGDADRDFDFDQLDLVQVQIAAKYLNGQAATWGEGDWDGAPGGTQGNPPAGNGFFDQLDIISALAAGTYLTGPYSALAPGGKQNDEQTSLVYNTATGELAVNAPVSTLLTSININSAGAQFIGSKPGVLDGAFDNFATDNIFKATFGGSFGEISFGSVLPVGLSPAEVAADLTAVGSLAGGGDLGQVDLVYIPEPPTFVIAALATLGILVSVWRKRLRLATCT